MVLKMHSRKEWLKIGIQGMCSIGLPIWEECVKPANMVVEIQVVKRCSQEAPVRTCDPEVQETKGNKVAVDLLSFAVS